MYIGPYTVVKRTLHGPYLLRDDTGAIYHRHVPIDQMKVVYTNNFIDNTQPLYKENDDDDESDVYVVDYIMNHKEEDGQFHYLVKWKGYDEKEATWEPEDHINDPQPIERYYKFLQVKEAVERKKSRTSRQN